MDRDSEHGTVTDSEGKHGKVMDSNSEHGTGQNNKREDRVVLDSACKLGTVLSSTGENAKNVMAL